MKTKVHELFEKHFSDVGSFRMKDTGEYIDPFVEDWFRVYCKGFEGGFLLGYTEAKKPKCKHKNTTEAKSKVFRSKGLVRCLDCKLMVDKEG